jgi:hypothetical protein
MFIVPLPDLIVHESFYPHIKHKYNLNDQVNLLTIKD